MGLEPTAYGLGSHRSTTELIPHRKVCKTNYYIRKNHYFCKIIHSKHTIIRISGKFCPK